MAVANISWILASTGKHVLIVDWSTETPALEGYLEPFLVDDELAVDADLAWRFATAEQELPHLRRREQGRSSGQGADIMLSRYGLPHGRGQIDVIGGVGPYGPPASTSRPSRAEAAFAAATQLADNSVRQLREALKDSEYDYVLVDCPTGSADANLACTARLPDVIVPLFRMGRTTIQAAASQVNSIRDRTGRNGEFVIVPVPSSVDPGFAERLQANRQLVSEEFHGNGRRALRLPVEIPYAPKYSHGDILAALADEPGQQGTLLRSYEAITSVITGGAVTVAQPMTDEVRQRYRRAVDIAGALQRETMLVAYAVTDRRWADWVRCQLERVGVRVQRLLDPRTAVLTGAQISAIVVIASEDFDTSSAADAVREWIGSKTSDPQRWGSLDITAARVDDGRLAAPFSELPVTELRRGSESVARTSLLSYFGLIRGPLESGTSFGTEPRYPYPGPDREGALGPERTVRLPPPNASFIGREGAIEFIRDQLCLNPAATMQVLRGVPGAGKSELAKEYAHRFRADYDVVWWIPADSHTAILASLTELAHDLDIPPAGDPATAILRQLDTTSGMQRWLLIYDNADDLELVSGFLPKPGSCHVLVTSRASVPDSLIATQVEPFGRADSVEFLRTYVPAITGDSADLVANVVRDLPLALKMAGAWLRETAARLQDEGLTVMEAESLVWSAAEFARRVQERLGRNHSESGAPDHFATAAACTAVSLDALGEADLGRVGARLVELCSFMAPDGVTLRLIYSPEMVNRLTAQIGDQGDSVRSDTVLVDQVCWTVSRYGLAELQRDDHPSLRLHPLTQELVKLSMPPDTRGARQKDALAALAAYCPADADGDTPEHNPTYAELHKHLIPSGALDSDDPAVRRWVVNEIRYLYRLHHAEMWRAACLLAERTLNRGAGDVASFDNLRLRLVVQLANIYRALGRYERAQALDEQVLHQQRRTLTQLHPRTLMTARSHGGDLRGLGRFDEALAEDQSTVAGFRTVFGEDHSATLMAVHNLALSWFLTGDANAATALELDVMERKQRLLGTDEMETWGTRCTVAGYWRELGKVDESRKMLQRAIDRLRNVDPDGAGFMAAERSLGISLRLLNRIDDALQHTGRALGLYRATHGDSHPDTLSCALSQAANLCRAGDVQAAVFDARRCLDGYLSTFQDDHPFSYICMTNLGIFLRPSGDVTGAVEMTGAGLDGLGSRLSPWHPWVIGASINHATSLLASGDLDAARSLDRSAYAESRDALGAGHPCTEAAWHNLQEDEQRAPGDLDISRRRALEIDVPQT